MFSNYIHFCLRPTRISSTTANARLLFKNGFGLQWDLTNVKWSQLLQDIEDELLISNIGELEYVVLREDASFYLSLSLPPDENDKVFPAIFWRNPHSDHAYDLIKSDADLRSMLEIGTEFVMTVWVKANENTSNEVQDYLDGKYQFTVFI